MSTASEPWGRHDWTAAIQRHDRRVYMSVLALGLTPDRAREVSQAAWTRLMEQHAKGALDQIDLPGLAIRQARFLAFNEMKRTKVEARTLAAVPEPAPEPDVERIASSRQEIAQVLAALATCPPNARKIFGIVYAAPGGTAAIAASQMGLSLQRVRQILCETRAQIRRAMEVTP